MDTRTPAKNHPGIRSAHFFWPVREQTGVKNRYRGSKTKRGKTNTSRRGKRFHRTSLSPKNSRNRRKDLPTAQSYGHPKSIDFTRIPRYDSGAGIREIRPSA